MTSLRDGAVRDSLLGGNRCARLAASRCGAALLGPHRERNSAVTGVCCVQLEPSDVGHEEGAIRNHGRVHRAIVSLLRVATCVIGRTGGGQTRVSRPE